MARAVGRAGASILRLRGAGGTLSSWRMKSLAFFAALFSACALFSAPPPSARDLPKRLLEKNPEFVPFPADPEPYNGKLPPEPSGCADFEIELPKSSGSAVAAADFGFLPDNPDCAAALNRALAHCRKIGASKLELAPGTYRCFVSDGVEMDSLRDVLVDGKGATLVFRRTDGKPNFSIKNCLRVKIRDLKIDWDWETDPLGAFVRVVGKHADKGADSYIDVEFVGFERYPLYGKPMPIKVMTLMDENCAGISNERGSAYFGTGDGHYGTKSEWLSPNMARIYPGVAPVGLPRPEDYPREYSKKKNFWISGRALVGRTYRIMHQYYGKNAFEISDSRHLTFENIDVYSCRGMGFLVKGGTSHWQAVNVSFVPRGGRPCSTTADVVHCTSNGGFAKLVGLRATLNQDDIFNFHDKAAFGKFGSPDVFKFLNMGGARYIGAAPGDEVEIFNADYTPANFRAKILSVDGNAARLDSPFGGGADGKGYILQKASHRTRNILIKDCVFKNHAGRGIMQSSDATIENCRFENGISIPLRFQRAFSMRDWAEGYGCRNVVVRGCEFSDAKINSGLYGVYHEIFAGSRRTDGAGGFDKAATASDILIEKCRFKNMLAMSLYSNFAKNVTFRDNKIEVSDSPAAKSYAGCALFENSENVAFVNNAVRARNPESIGAFICDTQNAVVAGNSAKKADSE